MKKNKTLLTLIAFLFSATLSFAQTTATQAVISETGILQLPVDQELKSSYEFDISEFNFENGSEAVDYFSNYGAEAFFMRPVFNQSKAILYLQLKDKPDWNAVDWNIHFREVMKTKPLSN